MRKIKKFLILCTFLKESFHQPTGLKLLLSYRYGACVATKVINKMHMRKDLVDSNKFIFTL